MDRLKLVAFQPAREYFAEELRLVMKRQNLSTQGEVFEYLVNILLQHMESQNFFKKNGDGSLDNNVLADLYTQSTQTNGEEKRVALQRLGDVSLIISGFFPDSLNRRVVDIDYYHGMGEAAYHSLSEICQEVLKAVYDELSKKFKDCAEVFSEISERSNMQSNADLLRLYEKWQITKSERLQELLTAKGILPVAGDNKNKN